MADELVNNKKNIIIVLLRGDQEFHLPITLCGWLGILLQIISLSRDLLQGFTRITLPTPKKMLLLKYLV